MDRHLARLENLLGEPIAGKVYWMRGPLLSSTHTFSRSTRKTTDKCRRGGRKLIRFSAAVRSRIAMRFVGVEPSGAGR